MPPPLNCGIILTNEEPSVGLVPDGSFPFGISPEGEKFRSRRTLSMNQKVRQNVLPVIAAFIWGTAFVAQSVGAEHVPPMTFSALRSGLAFLALLLLWVYLVHREKKLPEPPAPLDKKELLLGGLFCGLALSGGSILQQAGLAKTAPGKAGFITALYIVIVPVLGLFLHKKAPATVWVGVVLALGGLYFLCVTESLTVEPCDLYILGGSFVFSVHILLVDHYTQHVNAIKLSCMQFLVAGIVSGLGAFLTEPASWQGIRECFGSILYVGVFSGAVAFTLQIIAQKDANPTVVSLLLSLESVFAALAGAVILGDRLSGREILGCALMFAAVFLTQLPAPKKKSHAETAASAGL